MICGILLVRLVLFYVASLFISLLVCIIFGAHLILKKKKQRKTNVTYWRGFVRVKEGCDDKRKGTDPGENPKGRRGARVVRV